ncbi:MAG TPA: carbon-nitrogen hydrolase family protein [Mycobacterium sp.]|nr:carbon-nitrogen hydrolase family protein [Mycobacterium sp.]HQC75954.1 carbon-nitrogen hydrolase family protein [Mycobacterium sp.]
MALRIAGLQTAGRPGDVEANLAELERAAATAAGRGAGLLITPELFLTGYDVGDALYSLAAQPLLERACTIAREHDIALIVGLPEVAPAGRLYNSAVFIDHTGEVLARYRKTHLFAELDRRYFDAGDDAVCVVDYRGIRVAMMICYDVEFPENVRRAALAGAHLVAVPTAQMEPFAFIAESVIRTRAWENQVYVAYINHDGAEAETVYVGRSSIVAPDASVLDRIEHGDGLIYADVDAGVVAEAQRLNPYLSDRRPDLYGRT